MKNNHTPLLLRITAGRIPPLIVGLLVSFLTTAILTFVFEHHNIVKSWKAYQNNSFFYILAFGYLVFISRVIHDSHEKQFKQLLAYADLTPTEKIASAQEFKNHRKLWIETIIAMLVGLGHAYFGIIKYILDGNSKFLYLDIWNSIQLVFIWIMITQSVSIYTRNMTLMNRLSQSIEIDLLNLHRFMPLTKAGIVSILAFIGVYSILFIFAFSPSDFTSNPAMLVLAPTIFLMIRKPLKGIRKRIIKAKETEIDLIEAGIEGDWDALSQSRIGKNLKNINVIDLINYKKVIENTLELPVNIPTASRFVFYLIIPLLTWVAASMVDKVVDFIIK